MLQWVDMEVCTMDSFKNDLLHGKGCYLDASDCKADPLEDGVRITSSADAAPMAQETHEVVSDH